MCVCIGFVVEAVEIGCSSSAKKATGRFWQHVEGTVEGAGFGVGLGFVLCCIWRTTGPNFVSAFPAC